MRWLARFAAWATLLSLPCWLLAERYQRGLASVSASALAALGQIVEIDEVQIQAPFDLGLFAAMCLASLRAERGQRAQALLKGVPVLISLEILTVVLGVAVTIPSQSDPHAQAGLVRLAGYAIETVPWVTAGIVWLWLLGARELPAAAWLPDRRPESGRGT